MKIYSELIGPLYKNLLRSNSICTIYWEYMIKIIQEHIKWKWNDLKWEKIQSNDSKWKQIYRQNDLI